MAKTDGTQNVPSALLDKYRATLGEERPDNTIEKRYPYRVPTVQNERGCPSAAQRTQRDNFLSGAEKFGDLPQAERQRWYDSLPRAGAPTWYYDWYMLNAVPNLWGVIPGGAAVLSNIQHIMTELTPAGGQVPIPITCTPTKCVVMLYGNNPQRDFNETYGWGWGYPIYPVYDTFLPTAINLQWSTTPQYNAKVTVAIIEYI